MTGVMEEHQAAVEETGSAYEALQSPVEGASDLFQKAAPSMQLVTEHAQGMNESLSQVQQSFSDMNATLAEPGAAEAYSRLFESVAGESFAGSPLGNLQAFQEALASPNSFQIIDEHLDKTAQSYGQFADSLSEGNQQILHEMSTDWAQTNSLIDESGKSFVTAGKNAHEGFGAVAASAGEADQAVADFLGTTVKSAEEAGGAMKSFSIGESLSSTMSGMSDFFGGAGMGAMMAVQMVTQMTAQMAAGIYSAAAIAEGPAAHSFGTFTGQVDALGQSAQQVGGQFSESFGKQIIPTLDAMNYQMAQSSQIGGDLGGNLGGIMSGMLNWGQMIEGPALMMNPLTFNAGLAMTKAGFEGSVNQGAASLGMSEPFQGPGASSSYDVVSVVHQQTVQTHQQIQTLLEDASNPVFLQQQDQLSAAQQVYQRAQQSYDIRHPVNQQQMLQQFQEQQYDQQQNANYRSQMGQPAEKYSIGQALWEGLGGIFGGLKQTWGNIWGSQQQYDQEHGLYGSTGGCFVAGTRVLMADGSEKAIETLQVGEKVLTYDGIEQVATTILALIKPPQKRVYKLTFEDGRTLTLTDAHPLASVDGWKSLSPEATKQENPSLEVTPLHVGDVIYTVDGACTLTSILPLQGTRQVYNITVDAPHTFYANNVLVHNKMLSSDVGPQISEQVGGIQLPHIDLSGMSSQLAGAFGGISLPHLDLSGMTAGLAGAFSGISLPSIPDIGGQLSGALAGMFSGIAMPSIPDIGGMLSGALAGMFSGIAMPSIPDVGGMLSGALAGMFSGIAMPSPPDVGGMISGAMAGLFGGIMVPTAPDVGGMITGAMAGMFGGISIPTPPDLGGMINGAMSGMFNGISIPSVPHFASGVSNFSGGPAVVGEGGAPEVVGYNGGYSLFDKGAAFVNLPAGASVYPMKDLAGSSVAQFANGTGGGGFSPISLGGSGRNAMPESVNVVVHLDGQAILSAIGMPFAQTMRVQSGMRGF
jgi:hypothetical protein